MKVKLLYIIIPIIIILILTFILFRRSSPSSSPPPSTKNSSLPLSYPLQALTGPQIGRQIFATINVGGNNMINIQIGENACKTWTDFNYNMDLTIK